MRKRKRKNKNKKRKRKKVSVFYVLDLHFSFAWNVCLFSKIYFLISWEQFFFFWGLWVQLKLLVLWIRYGVGLGVYFFLMLLFGECWLLLCRRYVANWQLVLSCLVLKWFPKLGNGGRFLLPSFFCSWKGDYTKLKYELPLIWNVHLCGVFCFILPKNMRNKITQGVFKGEFPKV